MRRLRAGGSSPGGCGRWRGRPGVGVDAQLLGWEGAPRGDLQLLVAQRVVLQAALRGGVGVGHFDRRRRRWGRGRPAGTSDLQARTSSKSILLNLREKAVIEATVKELADLGRARLVKDGKKRLIQIRSDLLVTPS